MTAVANPPKQRNFKDKEKPTEVRNSNFIAAKAVADAARTSLGPRGMDKMILTADNQTVITNDGATLMSYMSVLHPAAKMLVELSKAQDVAAGDGTTSVVVLAGSLLQACEGLLKKGIHPSIISDQFALAAKEAVESLKEISIPVSMDDRESLLKSAMTSLNSKVVSQFSSVFSPVAVDAVLKVKDTSSVDLNLIRVIKKVGGSIEDTELVDGLVLNQTICAGPKRIEKAKIALIQFQLSAPKPDMDNTIIVNDYRQMDRILKEERTYLLNLCKKIKKSGCNVVMIQKSILRDATSELSLHFLSKLKIAVVTDIERDEIEFISKTIGCKPVADADSLTEEKLGYSELVEETNTDGSRILKLTGLKNSKTVSVLVRGPNQLVLDECERSLHDALCVIRSLVVQPFLIPGGGAPEIHMALALGRKNYCFEAFGEALLVIPTTLAENAGLNRTKIVTELRNKHTSGEKWMGINVKKGMITNIVEENVLQPLLVTSSAIELATETVMMMLKENCITYLDEHCSRSIHEQFNKTRQIDLGAESVVMLAENLSDRTQCAVKIFHRNTPPRTLALNIAISLQVDHPNIVKSFSCHREGDRYSLAMELLRGFPLADLYQDLVITEFYKKTTDWSKFERLLAGLSLQILDALSYLHSNDIVHGDVKPDNIFYQCDQGIIKLVDFGISEIGSLKTAMRRLSTIPYMAPEMFHGPPTFASDVYGLGITLLVMSCGMDPNVFMKTRYRVIPDSTIFSKEYIKFAFSERRLSVNFYKFVEATIAPIRPSIDELMGFDLFFDAPGPNELIDLQKELNDFGDIPTIERELAELVINKK